VVAFTFSTMFAEMMGRVRKNSASTKSIYEFYEKFGAAFARRVARQLRSLDLDPSRDVHFAFSTGAYESLIYARERGIVSVVDQLDPGKVDEEMIREESERWPDWDAAPGLIPDSYYARLAKEWDAADLVVVNSEFSRQAIHRQGVPLEKLVVVPLAYEAEGHAPKPRTGQRKGPLQVLWLGQIVLRKGIPYLFEAARLLQKENVQFTVAGRIGISASAIATAPPNLKVAGRVTREEAVRLYQTADVFVLPTISDGFALTQIEAMLHGVPVIVTSHCGDVVTHGEDGYIIPIRDPVALADAIRDCAADHNRLAEMSRRAIVKSRQFTVERYAATIEAAVMRFRNFTCRPAAVAPSGSVG